MRTIRLGLALGLAAALGFAATPARATQVAVSAVLTQTPATVDYPMLPASGGTVAYRLVVTNAGDELIDTLLVTDTLAAHLMSITTEQDGAFTVAIAQGPTGTIYSWSATSLTMGIGDSFTFTMTGRVGESCVPVVVSNTPFVVASGASTSTTWSANPAGFPLRFAIQVEQNYAPASPSPGQLVTYTLTVKNTGSSTVDALTLTDTIAVQVRSPGAWSTTTSGTWSLDVSEVAGTGTRFVWTGSGIGLAPGGSLAFTVTGTAAEACVAYTVSNTARVEAADFCATASGVSPLTAWSQDPGLPLLPPVGLTTRAGDGWAVLIWQPGLNEPPPLNVSRWYVWRATASAGTYIWTATVSGDPLGNEYDTRAFWDKGLTNGETYHYRVQAASGCVTLFSDEVQVTPMTASALTDSGKYGTVFHQAGDGYIRLNWTANPFPGETRVNRYKIQRATRPGSNAWTSIADVVNAGYSFDFGPTQTNPSESLVNGFEYWYMVTPCCPDRSPSFLAARPYKPARGVAQPAISTNPSCARGVRIAWEPAVWGTYTHTFTGQGSGYAIFRSDDGGATLGLLDTVPANILAYVDCTVPVYGKRYLYLIRPIDSQEHWGDAYPSALIDVVLPTIRTYPNRNLFRPGRGETVSIVYQTTEPGTVRVSVWTPGGELVRRLHEADYAGSITVDTPYNSRDRLAAPLIWDGTNDARELVGSGAYLIVIEVNGKRDFRSVAVLR